MSERSITFPEATLIRLPAGTLKQVKTEAGRQGRSSAEFLRHAIRQALAQAEVRG